MNPLKLFAAVVLLTSCQQGAPMGSRVLDSLYVSGYGAAAASGTVQFYQPGTLVPVTVYSDDALTQSVSQPITLDATGKTPLPVYTASPLRAIIKSQAGATLQDITRIDGDRAELVQTVNAAFPGSTTLDAALTAIGASLGGSDGNYLAPYTGAVQRTVVSKFAETVSVKDFGAVGNGIADDTTKVQAAIDAAQTAGGGTVLFPKGNYLISSELRHTSQAITLQGISAAIVNSNATGNAVRSTSTGALTIRSLRIAHSSSSSGIGVSFLTGTVILDAAVILNHTTGVSATTVVESGNSIVGAVGSGTAIAIGSGGTSTIIGGTYAAGIGTGTGISVTGGTLTIIGASFTSGAVGIDLGATANLYAYGCSNFADTIALGLQTATTTSTVVHYGCEWGAVNDRRTGAPVAYSLSTSSAVAPNPLQTEIVRIVATAAITVTVSAPPGATGFGRRWTLMCLNSSGGAVTWTFNAAYKLSAAVAPATGNMVSLILEYDPISAIWRETGRAATAI